MAKLVRIYNINQDAYGKPFAICAKHLKEMKRKFVIVELCITRNQHCEGCSK